MEAIPGDRIRSMTFEYRTLGYERLELLNATDRKWLVEIWGEPDAHSTLNVLNRNLWRELEDRLMRKRQEREERIILAIKSCLLPARVKPIAETNKKGLLARLLGL